MRGRISKGSRQRGSASLEVVQEHRVAGGGPDPDAGEGEVRLAALGTCRAWAGTWRD